ncbi:MAG: ABC transporter substrate-binding protein [Christensenellales bacterium]
MLKKILSIAIAVAMVLTLAACTPTVEPAKTTAPPAAPAQTSAPAPTATIAQPYYIGMYTALTGSGASTGDQQVKGAKVAIEEINAAGGIKGRPIELIVYDDATTTEGAVKAVTRLIEEDKVDVIAGGYLSPNIIATYPQTEAAKVLQVGVGTGTTWTNIGNKYLFRATTNAKLPNATFVKKMVEMGEKTTSLISLESDYGQSGRTNVLELLGKTDIKVLAEATYQSSETDFTGHISKLMAPNPDSIIMYGNGYEMALIIKQLRQQGFTKNVYTCEGGANTDILKVAGPAADGLIFGCAYVVPKSIEAATNEKESAYLKHFVEMYGEMPLSDVSYRGYDQLHLIALALNGSKDYTNRDANADAFKAIKGYIGLAGIFDFTAGTGDGLTGSNAYMILDQQIQIFEKAAMDTWKAAQ